MPRSPYRLKAVPIELPTGLNTGSGNSGVPVAASYILPGRAGIWQTLQKMRELSLAASRDPSFNAWARSIAGDAVSNTSVVRILFDFVHRSMRYQDDPLGPAESWNDYLKDPKLIRAEIDSEGLSSGDCDDFVMLYSALLASFGISHAMIALAIPDMGDGLNHVVVGIPLVDGTHYLLDTVTGESQVSYQASESLAVTVI